MTTPTYADSPKPTYVKRLRVWGVALSLTLAGLVSLIPFLPGELPEASPLWLLSGRMHPLVLHFPIVVCVLLLVFTVLSRFVAEVFAHPAIIGTLLVLGTLSTGLTAYAGYLLFAADAYSGATVADHLTAGVITGLGISVCSTYYFYCFTGTPSPAQSPVFFTILLLTNAILAYTSHLGGTLTHGSDFLSEPISRILPKKDVPIKPVEEWLVYEDVIHTILDSKCMSCHNENKTKGNLLMTSYENLLKAGDSGKKALIPGVPDSSELLVRVHLPLDHDERMPPEGKPGLSESEIRLLTYWIETGAETSLKVTEIRENAEFNTLLEPMIARVRQAQVTKAMREAELASVEADLVNIASELQIRVDRDPESEGNLFRIRMMFPPKRFSNEELLKLEPYFEYFSTVSLASADIADDELYFIGKMRNLKRLFIQKTRVDGSGLPYFHHHQALETINLSFVPMIPGNVFHLLDIPNLKKVFIFGTPVKPEIILALQSYRPDIEFVMEEGPLF